MPRPLPLIALCAAGVAAAAGPAWAQEDPDALPPPPVYTAPEGAAPPAQPYYQPPAQAAPPVYQPSVPPGGQPVRRWRPQFGIGLRGMGTYSDNGLVEFGQGGAAADLLLRVSPRLVTELSVGYLRVGKDRDIYDRTDVPVTLGLRVHLARPRSVLSPYFAFAAGATWARLHLPATAEFPEELEHAWFLEGQLGGGLELRLGRHFAINADLRGVGGLRVDRGPRLVTANSVGEELPFMGNQLGLRLGLGLAGYF